jgi:hypothetical protein
MRLAQRAIQELEVVYSGGGVHNSFDDAND